MSRKLDCLKSMSILYLEDDLEIQKNISETLTIYFKSIFAVDSIVSAKEYFIENSANVILVDIELIDGNGLEFIKWIREFDTNTYIIVVTSHSDSKFLFEAIPLMLIDYILKPITFDKLNNLLFKIVDKIESDNNLWIDLPESIKFNSSTLEILNIKDIKLTKLELELLALLIKNRDRIVTYELIDEELCKSRVMNIKTIRNQINKLRLVFGKNFIKLHSKIGYKIEL